MSIISFSFTEIVVGAAVIVYSFLIHTRVSDISIKMKNNSMESEDLDSFCLSLFIVNERCEMPCYKENRNELLLDSVKTDRFLF